MIPPFIVKIFTNPKNVAIGILAIALATVSLTLYFQNLRIDSYKKEIVIKNTEINSLNQIVKDLNSNISSIKEHNDRLQKINEELNITNKKINNMKFKQPEGYKPIKLEGTSKNEKETNPVNIANSIIDNFNSRMPKK